MEIWYYVEQAIIGLLFVLSCWQLFRVFFPSKTGNCSKGCSSSCPAQRITKQLEQVQLDNSTPL